MVALHRISLVSTCRRCLSLAVLLAVLMVNGLMVNGALAQRWRSRRPEPQPEPTSDPEPADVDSEESDPEDPEPEPTAQDDDEPSDSSGPSAADSDSAMGAEPGDTDPQASAGDLGPDLSPIRSEFSALMDELIQLRSRTAVLGQQLFNTRVSVTIENQAADDNTLERLVLRLDGAPIYQADGEIHEDGQSAFQGFAAPGPHVLSVEAEQRQRADQNFRYTVRDGFRFQVVRDRLTEITIILEDDSNMAEDFEDDGEGVFDVRTRFRVATREIDETDRE